MKDYLRYVRDDNGNGVGAVKIVADGDSFGIGVALCHPSDKFSKEEANHICDVRLYESFKDSPYTFYDMVDNYWYDDVMSQLPHSASRANDVDKVITTIMSIVDDVIMDYAKMYLRSIDK